MIRSLQIEHAQHLTHGSAAKFGEQEIVASVQVTKATKINQIIFFIVVSQFWILSLDSQIICWTMLTQQLKKLGYRGLRKDLIYFSHSLLTMHLLHLVLIGL